MHDDNVRLFPARRDVVMGLYEGREIIPRYRVRGSRTVAIYRWEHNGAQIPDLVLARLWAAGLLAAFADTLSLTLTDSGRALAERLAKEGR